MQLEFFPSNTVVVWMEKKLYRDNSAKSFMFGYRGYLVRFIVIYNRGGGGEGAGGTGGVHHPVRAAKYKEAPEYAQEDNR